MASLHSGTNLPAGVKLSSWDTARAEPVAVIYWWVGLFTAAIV
jgi:hypothetical protein